MSNSELVLEYRNKEELIADYRSNLQAGGAFLKGVVGREKSDPCRVVIAHPNSGEELRLEAQVVWVSTLSSMPGVGVAFTRFDDESKQRLARFVGVERFTPPPASPAAVSQKSGRGEEREARVAAVATDSNSEGGEQGTGGSPSRRATRTSHPPPERLESLQQRLRGISMAKQMKIARDGELTERVALERIYGKNVWEALLRNPRVTQPEVARIARMGALPKPLIEIIVANTGWVRGGQIRRALLSNPRLSRDQARKVIAAAPKNELRLMTKQTSYPHVVREIARKLIKDRGGF
jgi:Tfp pilus assembly protein PilZ